MRLAASPPLACLYISNTLLRQDSSDSICLGALRINYGTERRLRCWRHQRDLSLWLDNWLTVSTHAVEDKD